MNQLITGTTHISPTAESCIDLLLVSKSVETHSSGIIFNPLHNGITWHNFTYLSINTKPVAAPRKIIQRRNFKNFDPLAFLHDASQIKHITDDNTAADNITPNQLANELETAITILVNKHAPMKRIRVRPTRKPWITKELLNIISIKNRLFKRSANNTNQLQWETFKEYRNYVKRKIRAAKVSYYHTLIKNAEPNNNWQIINQLANKINRTSDINELTYEGTTHTEPIEVANALNTFFSTIGTKINTELKLANHPNCPSWMINRTGFKFHTVTETTVTNTISKLCKNKKGGKDQIPTFIFKLLCPYISRKLTYLINKVITLNSYPDIWKEALITPIPKSGVRTDPSNYRPIASLPILSKVSEKIIANQIRQFTETNKLISSCQYGFRENHSTQSLLLQLTNKWLRALDDAPTAKCVCLTALDIKKAFDTIEYEILLSKLANIYNFHPSAIKLIHSYLIDRVQSVKINNIISDSLPVKSGVPQGSVIGPLLFIMFINDLTTIGSCYLFADDCIIEQSADTPETAILNTNTLITRYTNWYQSNLLKLNADKTTTLMLTNRNTPIAGLQQVSVNGHYAPFSPSLKYLGLILDRSLNWNYHVTHLRNKIMPIVWNFARTRHLMNTGIALTFYTSLIRPHLEYASAVLHNMSQTNCQTIETIQNKCLKIIAQCHPYTPSTYLRKQLHLPSLKQRRSYFFLCEFYKIYNNINETVTDNFIMRANTRPNYNIRREHDIFIPFMNKSVGQRALCYLGPKTYNHLPEAIKVSHTYGVFKGNMHKPDLKIRFWCVYIP